MADRYTIDTTRFIPPNLRGIASTLGLDDASNFNAVVSMFMRPRDAAARFSQPEKYSPTGKREMSDLIEAGMGPAEALLGVGLGKFLSEPIRRTLMSMMGIDSTPDRVDAPVNARNEAGPRADNYDLQRTAIDEFLEARAADQTNFEAMYGADRGSLDASGALIDDPASMTDSELLDMFNREYPDAEDVALQSVMFDDETLGLPVADYYDPEYVPDADDIQEMLDNGATPAEVRQLMDQQSRLNVDDEFLEAQAAAQARDDAGIVDDFDPSIAFPDVTGDDGTFDAQALNNAITNRDFDPNDPFSAVGYEGDGTPVPGAFPDGPPIDVDDAAIAAGGDFSNLNFTQVPVTPPELNYEIKDPSSGLQAALQTVSRKSGLKFPDGEAAFKALKSQGVTDAELEARGLMSLKGLTNFDGTAAAKMLSGFQERMTGGKFSDDIDLSSPIRITEMRGAGTDYEQYFTPGGTDYLETVYTLRDNLLGSNLSNKLKNKTAGHHPEAQMEGPTLFHTRSAVYDVDGGGSTFHLGEIQSDVNGSSRTILKNRKILEDLGSDRAEILESMYYTGGQKPSEVEMFHGSRVPTNRAIGPKDQEILDLLEGTIFKKNIVEANDSRSVVQQGYSERFSQLPVTEQVDRLMSELTDLRNTRGNKTASELGVGKLYDTATITRMAIRRSLEQASDSGADFFTLGTGQMAKNMTYGDLGGQKEYYDKIVPGALKKVLNKLGADSKLEMPKMEDIPMYGADQDGMDQLFMVPGFKMTDNFRKAVAEFGMPVFRDGGRVDVSRFTGLGSMGYML